MPSHRPTSSSTTPAYQVECQMTKKGKMFAGSKRRVCWRFGFASRDAIEAGQTGTDCRGEEHEVVMVWSLTSRKQLVLADGHEVHWSKSRKMFDKFECDWNMASGRHLSVVAHASSPLFDKKEGFRQFDLKINGVSFWDLPQMYELGAEAKPNQPSNPQPSPSTPSLRQVSPLMQHEDSMDDQYSVVSDIHASFYRSQPQLSCLDSCLQVPRTISPSPSMPDILDFSTSAPSPPDRVPPMPHSSFHTAGFSNASSLTRRIENPSPTSVMTNPFDVYASPPNNIHNHKVFTQKQMHPQPPPFHANDILSHYAPSLQSPRANDPWSMQQQRQQCYQQQLQQKPFPATTPSQHQPYVSSQSCSVYAGY
ncbi:hypothetical protein IV203_016849 [Nitzschia inconspicua]|uniref:Uncharacterized protein n=1 Tax=Nitzschia inconspicua TaxID=303405 RepID=A0A9K3KRV6_9STRA|nr:hypothetical protein IV203_016849 [Nitzschia inconspicua]